MSPKTAKTLEIAYGPLRNARGRPNRERPVFTISKHMDVMVDDMGRGKVMDLKIDETGCIPVVLELDGQKTINVLTYKVRPLASIKEYDQKCLLTQYENKRKLIELGLLDGEGPATPKAKKTASADLPPAPDRTTTFAARTMRKRAAAAAPAAAGGNAQKQRRDEQAAANDELTGTEEAAELLGELLGELVRWEYEGEREELCGEQVAPLGARVHDDVFGEAVLRGEAGEGKLLLRVDGEDRERTAGHVYYENENEAAGAQAADEAEGAADEEAEAAADEEAEAAADEAGTKAAGTTTRRKMSGYVLLVTRLMKAAEKRIMEKMEKMEKRIEKKIMNMEPRQKTKKVKKNNKKPTKAVRCTRTASSSAGCLLQALATARAVAVATALTAICTLPPHTLAPASPSGGSGCGLRPPGLRRGRRRRRRVGASPGRGHRQGDAEALHREHGRADGEVVRHQPLPQGPPHQPGGHDGHCLPGDEGERDCCLSHASHLRAAA
jgi:hypothetical protein